MKKNVDVQNHLTRFVVFSLCLIFSSVAFGQQRDIAKKMHDRLVGLPPSPQVLNQMEQMVTNGDSVGAAMLAMQNPAFYNVSLKNWVTPWTNEEEDVHQPLNDYTATVIGMIRDDVPFNEVLSRDVIYVGANGLANVDAYSHNNNDHYEDLENRRYDLSDSSVLVARTQSGLPGAQITADKTGGVLTTRAAGKAFYSAGTNRLVFRQAMFNYMCKDMEDLNDISRTPDRIRQDVTRSPGGDSNIFLTTCIGCHSGMDPMAGAFAYFEYDEENGRLTYTPDQVQGKFLINNTTFKGGYVTTDDGWKNYWREGVNSSLGWSSGLSGSGNGPKSLGEEIGNSEGFAICQVQKVFHKLCLRKPRPNEESVIRDIVSKFKANNYNMKTVFAEAAVHCAQ